MARRGRAAWINTETALSMLDVSLSGSEFDGLDSDHVGGDREDDDLESDVQHVRSDEQESGTSTNDRESGSTVADDGSSSMMRDFDDRPSTSRDAYGGGVCGELGEPEGSQSDSDCRESGSDDADVEGNPEPTPKSRKRVRRPQGGRRT